MTVERSAFRARVLMLGVAFIGLAVFVLGLILLIVALVNQPHSYTFDEGLAVAFTPVIIMGWGLLVACAAALLYPIASAGFRRAIDEHWNFEQLRGSLENQRQILETIRENGSVSDAAKQIAFRHKDRDALRHAIRDDLDKNDYDAAVYLANEMDRRFGYHEEAAAVRREIDTARRQFVDNQVREAVDMVDQAIAKLDWADAVRQTDVILRKYPGRADVQKLPERISAARDNHKRGLLKQWTESVARDDVDKSIDLLRQLDQYLTPGEAEGYKEVARDVFKKRLSQLSVQFAINVHDKNWNDAVRIGRQITDEFPNSRIAAEVKDRIPILLEKAGAPGAPPASASTAPAAVPQQAPNGAPAAPRQTVGV